jgi:hypothetical protein
MSVTWILYKTIRRCSIIALGHLRGIGYWATWNDYLSVASMSFHDDQRHRLLGYMDLHPTVPKDMEATPLKKMRRRRKYWKDL